MTVVKVSPKYQVVIPKQIREQARIEQGARLLVVLKDGVISLLPDTPVARLRGFAPHLSHQGARDHQDRV